MILKDFNIEDYQKEISDEECKAIVDRMLDDKKPPTIRKSVYKKIAWNNYILHNEFGPALIMSNGDRHWYFDGMLHRTDGPAIECSGSKHWYSFGKRSRLDGPASLYPTRIKKPSRQYFYEFYIEGIKFTYEDYIKEINK